MTEFSPQPDRRPVFKPNIIGQKDLLNRKDIAPAIKWYQETAAKLPEMKVNITPIKDAKESTANPDFFSYANVDVTTATGSWQQGGILERGENGVHGVTILLTDPDGKIFVTLGREPLAKGAVVRSPLQSSAEKLKRVTESPNRGRATDPAMAAVLGAIATEKNMLVSDVVNSVPLSRAATDGNRMQSEVLYGTIPVSQRLAEKIAKDVPLGRWTAPKELDALTVMGVTNGSLNIARSVTESQRKLAH